SSTRLDPAKAELLGFLAAEGNEYHYSRSHDRFFPDRGPAGKWYRINYRQNAIEFTNVEPVIQQRFYDLLVKVYGKQKSSFGSKYRIRIRRKQVGFRSVASQQTRQPSMASSLRSLEKQR